jgi:Fic family protein
MSNAKPVAPVDLWQQMDELVAETGYKRPEDHFTMAEFRQRYDLTSGAAEARLDRLVAIGKVEKIKVGSRNYYKVIPS